MGSELKKMVKSDITLIATMFKILKEVKNVHMTTSTPEPRKKLEVRQ